MKNMPLKMESKVSTELLSVFAKTVDALKDCELNEAFNRIEIQVREYEESKQHCDLTYLRDLCNQFSDKLTQVCKFKSEMVRQMLTPEMLERIGLKTIDKQDDQQDKSVTAQVIGFHS